MRTTEPGPFELARDRILARRPVFDAHVDSIGRALDLEHDLGERGAGQLDLVRAAEGGLGAWVVVAWVDPELFPDAAFERTRAMFRATRQLEARHPDRFRIVGNDEELEAAAQDGCIAGIPGIEGGHAIEGSLENLAWFFEQGLRVMTLVWNNHLPWIRSCEVGAGPDVPAGLSSFGRKVVREMNRLGIVVDLSHAGVQSFYDALEETRAPAIASHSGCRALHDHPRNLDDEQLRRLAANGGVFGVVFYPPFLDAAAREEAKRVRTSACVREIVAPDPAARFLKRQRIMRAKASPMSAERVADHIVHAVNVIGVDHVGIGSDYDGIDWAPEKLEDASCYGHLAELLLQRGFAEDEVARILGDNMRRVFAAATGPGTCAFESQRAALV